MKFLAFIYVFTIDFLLTALCYWLVTLVLNLVGITVAFTWSWTFAIWVIAKIIKFCI